MEKIEYTIAGVKYYHEELTWGQDKALFKFLSRAAGSFSMDEEIGIQAKRAAELLARYDLLGRFWFIVLTPVKDWRYWWMRLRLGFRREIDLSDAPNSMIGGMMEDFFTLNKALMKKLSSLNDALGFIARMAMANDPALKNGKTKNSTSTPAAATSAGKSTSGSSSTTPPEETPQT